ncbi:Photosynthetic NDH subunit of lumenal location 4, chloroplastic [Linum grandiflorum]
MALSTSAITTPKSLFRAPPLPFYSKPNCSCVLSSSSPQLNHKNADNNSSFNSVSKPRNRIIDVGIGILAAATIAVSPMDADATRIEYYATVGEPLYKRQRPLTMRLGVGKVRQLWLILV